MFSLIVSSGILRRNWYIPTRELRPLTFVTTEAASENCWNVLKTHPRVNFSSKPFRGTKMNGILIIWVTQFTHTIILQATGRTLLTFVTSCGMLTDRPVVHIGPQGARIRN